MSTGFDEIRCTDVDANFKERHVTKNLKKKFDVAEGPHIENGFGYYLRSGLFDFCKILDNNQIALAICNNAEIQYFYYRTNNKKIPYMARSNHNCCTVCGERRRTCKEPRTTCIVHNIEEL